MCDSYLTVGLVILGCFVVLFILGLMFSAIEAKKAQQQQLKDIMNHMNNTLISDNKNMGRRQYRDKPRG